MKAFLFPLESTFQTELTEAKIDETEKRKALREMRETTPKNVKDIWEKMDRVLIIFSLSLHAVLVFFVFLILYGSLVGGILLEPVVTLMVCVSDRKIAMPLTTKLKYSPDESEVFLNWVLDLFQESQV